MGKFQLIGNVYGGDLFMACISTRRIEKKIYTCSDAERDFFENKGGTENENKLINLYHIKILLRRKKRHLFVAKIFSRFVN